MLKYDRPKLETVPIVAMIAKEYTPFGTFVYGAWFTKSFLKKWNEKMKKIKYIIM